MDRGSDERLVSELEATIGDAGALLVRIQKYHDERVPPAAALAREVLSLGDTIRRLHRRHRLDAEQTLALLAEARGIVERLRAALASVHADPVYRAAAAAHAAGDQLALAELIPKVFTGVEPARAPRDLFVTVEWKRRGGPRPASDLVGEALAVRDEGIVADTDELAPGRDPALPAVVLFETPPPDASVVLRLAAPALGVPLYRMIASGAYLAYTTRLRALPVVRLATRPAEDEERVALEWERYREALAGALVAAGVAVEDAPID